MKTIYRLLFYLSLISTTKAGETGNAEPFSRAPTSQRELISVVLHENPALKAAQAKWEAMKARVSQARAWEDPRAAGDFRVERSVNIPPNSFMDQTAMLEQE